MKITKLLDGTPINEKEFMKWIAALRSGEFKQGVKRLQTGKSFCCLGVACKVLIPEELQLMTSPSSGRLAGTTPRDQESSPQWLKGINQDVIARTGTLSNFGELISMSLMAANDVRGFTFEEIANVLEDIYVHGIFEEN